MGLCHTSVTILEMPPKGSRTAMPRAGASARGQEKVALQSEVMPEVKRSKRSNEDAVFPMNKRNAQRDVTRAVKQIVQDAVFPTSKPSSEAHGGSREHAGRPRELSRGQRDYENMVAVATKQRLLWDTQNAAAGDAALGACAPVKLAADGILQCVHPKHHTCDNCPNPGAGCEAITALYAAATGVALVMEQPPGRVSELIRKCVHVSDEKKAQLITDWEAADMAHGLPIPGCASCGNRDPTLEYSKRNVSELPTYFRLNVQRCSELELLGADGSNGVDLYSSDGSASRVDHFSGCQFISGPKHRGEVSPPPRACRQKRRRVDGVALSPLCRQKYAAQNVDCKQH